ncbi:MAG: trypsin-like serine protease [Hyalangium sp.]|uniref:trypsin-like serine protease n=1 Tax=Hyalangium sp. TaxID=2028555 RepID=UPI00389A7644
MLRRELHLPRGLPGRSEEMMRVGGDVRRRILVVLLLCCGSGGATEKSDVGPPAEGEGGGAGKAVRDEFGISDGTVDVENRYRSVVSIRNGKSSCSGVLVASRLVLTAAHCFCQPRSGDEPIIDGSNCAQEVAGVEHGRLRRHCT